MTSREAYENAYRWHRAERNGKISQAEVERIRSLFVKHKLIRYWQCAERSLNDFSK